MKKFFKWIWYNKEQLVSIIYSIIIIAITNVAVWTDTLNGYTATLAQIPVFASIGGELAVRITAVALAVGGVVLTIRNVCVKYGLSSLETIDEELAKRAAKKANKLTSEQKKRYKTLISTLQTEREKVVADVANAETELAKITDIYNADHFLVTDYITKRQTFEKKINHGKAAINSIDEKIVEYKAIISGTKSAAK